MRKAFFASYWFWHCGEGFQTILFTWYMVFYARLSATEIGFYQSLQLFPFLFLTAIGGTLTDRIGARTSFAAATGLFALALAGYGINAAGEVFSPWLFGAYCLASGILSAISNPAIDTFIPEASPRPTEDNALIAATVHNIAKLSGNIATLLLPVLSAPGGFAVNGALMAVSAALILWMPRRQPVARPTGRGLPLRRVMAHFRANPVSFDILLGSAMLGLLVIPAFYVFKPLTFRLRFPDEGDLYALTGIVGWIGAILAASLAVRLSPRIARPGRVALGIWGAGALLTLSLLVVPGFAGYIAILFLLGANQVGKALIYGRYLREAPTEDRGTLIGIDQTAFWGLATIGTMWLGWLVDRIGLADAMILNTGAILASVALLALRRRISGIGRRSGDFPEA
ncbi:MAG TPA: MFS transporter [Albidovulum sp.]|uniref:MFS transporter n=1 Tax=Albidovulum sp. TaxID=1872424 RepID=UPI002B67BD44|nr:MFS transporter [Albidovulum sp.]